LGTSTVSEYCGGQREGVRILRGGEGKEGEYGGEQGRRGPNTAGGKGKEGSDCRRGLGTSTVSEYCGGGGREGGRGSVYRYI